MAGRCKAELRQGLLRVLRSYPEDRDDELAHRAPPSVVLGADDSWRAPSCSPKAFQADASASKEGGTEVGSGGGDSRHAMAYDEAITAETLQVSHILLACRCARRRTPGLFWWPSSCVSHWIALMSAKDGAAGRAEPEAAAAPSSARTH